MTCFLRPILNWLFILTLIFSTVVTQASERKEFRKRISASRVTSIDEIKSDIENEIKLGREIASRILGKYKLSNDIELNKYLTIIGRGITTFSNRPELTYHFALIETDEINAYTAPGGYIFITRGALNLMQDEAELAAVLAHEIAHVTQKHIVKRVDIKSASNGLEASLLHLLGGTNDPTHVAFTQAIDDAVKVLFSRGLDKNDEFEADRIGMLMASLTGYDPAALHRYLERVKNTKSNHRETISHTHPPFTDRLNKLQELQTEEGLDSIDALRIKNGKQRFLRFVKK